MTHAQAKLGLSKGERFQSLNGQRHGVAGELLGQGGQGAVFKSNFGTGVYAVKWYHDNYVDIDVSLKDRLRRAISRGAPDDRFLWPLELVFKNDSAKTFGYVMGLRPSEFRSIRELLAPPPNRIELSLEKRIFVCWQIADSFLSLHAKGFCYQDINFGNFFLHPSTGRVMICDNDNVNIDGGRASVYGTRKFMAPEIVRRETTPNGRTDLYSMAVLFFYILMGWHPLDGKREADVKILTPEIEQSLYGTDPLFIFDQDNDANGPMSPMHDMIECRWRSLSPGLRNLFCRAFGAGLHHPNNRVLEKEWIRILEADKGATFACQQCRYECIVSLEDQMQKTSSCPHCSADLAVVAILKIGKRRIVLSEDTVVSKVDLGERDAKSWESAAMVVEHPERPGVLGLRNTTSDAWSVKRPDGSKTLVSPDRTVLLTNGLKINIGPKQADVWAPRDINLKDKKT